MQYQGNYTPSLPQSTMRYLLIAVALEALFRGVGFLIQNTPRVDMTLVEEALSLDVWGIFLVMAASVTLMGIALKRARLIFYGATTSTALYLTLSWGAALQMADIGWPWNGFKTVTTLIILGLVWVLIAHGTRVMMLAQKESEKNGGPW